MKNILFLDANETIVPAITYAKKQGYRVITCDNITSHIGHKYADVYYNVSTYDTEKLLEIAYNEKINGVVYFSSAHGLYGGSVIIEKLNLPGIPNFIEQLFSNKGQFRKFLEKNELNFPIYSIVDSSHIDIEKIKYPVIVKPVDSSGGNIGVTKVNSQINIKQAINEAIDKSFSKQALIERYIDSDIQINGDCLISNGEVSISFFGKYIYRENSLIPYATIFGPDVINEQNYKDIKNEVQKIVKKSGIFNGIINVELRIDKNDNKPYTIEINPRHSGNRIYKLMNIEYGLSFEHISVDNALGLPFNAKIHRNNGYYAYCILYSENKGILKNISVNPELEEKILERFDFKHKNEEISEFKLLKDRISLLLLSFNSKDEMESIICNIKKFYHIDIC